MFRCVIMDSVRKGKGNPYEIESSHIILFARKKILRRRKMMYVKGVLLFFSFHFLRKGVIQNIRKIKMNVFVVL
jgi:hypothetical protein